MKRPEARPRPAAVLARLERATSEPTGAGSSRLALVNQAEVAQRMKEQSAHQFEVDRTARESELFQAAGQLFSSFWEPLVQVIEDEAPTATVKRNVQGTMLFVAELGGAKVGVGVPKQHSWHGKFSVIASAVISVSRGQDRSGWNGRSHSLWYCDPYEANVFGWHEVAFMTSPFSNARATLEPFSRDPGSTKAFDGVMGTEQQAWPMELLDRDDPTEFVDRWIGWFADAAAGRLGRPSHMPEKRQSRRYRA